MEIVSAVVIRKNAFDYIKDPVVARIGGANVMTGIGITQPIECPGIAGGQLDGDYWATPVDDGLLNGIKFTPYNVATSLPAKPKYNSFAVVRVSNNQNSDVNYLLGTSTQFIAACAVCCGGTPAPMPLGTTIPFMGTCQTMCKYDAANKYNAVLGLPTIGGGLNYLPYGSFNGKALPAPAGADAAGFANTTTLLAFLNTATTGTTTLAGGWGIVGVWSVNAAGNALIATQAAGPGTDVLCANVAAIVPA